MVTLSLLVGDMKPGTRPIMLQPKMNRPTVPMTGRYLRPSGPMVSTMSPSNSWMIISATLWRPPGTRAGLREAKPRRRMRRAATMKTMTR